jgi:chromosome partitioning protein
MYPKMLVSEAADILNVSVQSIHKKLKEMNLEVKKEKHKIHFTHSTSKELFKKKFVKKVYSFQLVKGGVGKTVISLNFAIRASLLGAKVALIELDQQANLTRTFNINANDQPIMIDIVNDKLSLSNNLVEVLDGLHFLPSRVDNALLDNTLLLGKHPLDKVFTKPIQNLKKMFDIIVIDCPPSIGPSVVAAALASDTIVLPINPTDYSLAGLELTFNELQNLFEQYEKEIQLKILFNKYNARTNLSFNTISEIIKHPKYSKYLIQGYIRHLQAIDNSIAENKSVFDTFRKTPEKEDFSVITSELLEEINNA